MIVKELLIKNCHTIQANNTNNNNNNNTKSKSKSKNDPNDLVSLTEQGFTLIELMLSMSLGLLISAAAFQLFTHSISSQRLQQSMSDVQDVAVFGFNAMTKEIAHANLGASYPMRQNSAWTGIVLTGSEQGEQITKEGLPIKVGNLRGVRGIESEWLTRNNAGPSNIVAPTKSDQLTIQYRAPYNSYDCEGRHIEQGDMVIERYFTRVDNQRAKNETKALAIVLACDAGRYQVPKDENANSITKDNISVNNFGDNGVVLINRIDYFSVKLGVKLAEGLAYMPINTYLTERSKSATNTLSSSDYRYDGPVVAIELAIIGRANNSLGKTNKMATTIFNVQGSDYQIREKTPHFVRLTLQNVVMLRNNHVTP